VEHISEGMSGVIEPSRPSGGCGRPPSMGMRCPSGARTPGLLEDVLTVVPFHG
jgi:hypothetical protein